MAYRITNILALYRSGWRYRRLFTTVQEWQELFLFKIRANFVHSENTGRLYSWPCNALSTERHQNFGWNCLFNVAIDSLTPSLFLSTYMSDSGRTRGAKKSDRGVHFDRRELAQVDSKSSHFFSRRSPGAWRGKVSTSSTWTDLYITTKCLMTAVTSIYLYHIYIVRVSETLRV